uniref:Uncharacterized protein n=1 Tax=Panagrolaimus superbus TaxID=310955 RepID=A0A914ZCJ6_9BILA
MQKLIALPMTRYKNLTNNEKPQSGWRETIDATMKNQENQELLQRQRYYEETQEEMPKNHNKVISQKAVAWLPPPSRINKYLKQYKKPTLDDLFGLKSRKTKKIGVPKQLVIKKKPAIKEPDTTKLSLKPTVPSKPPPFKFNLNDPNAFHRKKK